MKKNQAFLTTTEFHILLALRSDPLHGYEIIKQVEHDTSEAISLLTGTLYNALKRFMLEKLIESTPGEVGEDARRKYYKLTDKGRRILGAELSRYEATVRLIAGDPVSSMR
jgi:PadR family transcriptional regulator, regulatory protein PadR